MGGRAEKYLERRLKRQSLDCKNEKGKNHVGGDFVYIVPPNGRDAGTTDEGSPDFAAWHHQGCSAVRRFDAPPFRLRHVASIRSTEREPMATRHVSRWDTTVPLPDGTRRFHFPMGHDTWHRFCR